MKWRGRVEVEDGSAWASILARINFSTVSRVSFVVCFIFFKSVCVFALLYFCSSCIHFTFMALIICRIIYQVSLIKILNKKKRIHL